ncbi:MAG TPA: DUF2723 domain-containing protein [Gemmatimonadales bacterium]
MWLGYVLTLAPTVTLWDAGEYIVAAKTLGIPHPPGTPLFVLLGNVWGQVLALGEYAWRLNLMSATFSAAGAGCLFLVAHEVLRDEGRTLRLGGAAAAAILSGFTFTAWQNSNETEVYMVATFSIAAVAWLCLRWRATRGSERAPHLLLLVVYLLALSIGNHLMALLVGPAVAAFLWHVLRKAPAADPVERRVEWSEAATVAALWVVLLGAGLGKTAFLVLGGLAFAAALAYAATARATLFPLVALAVAALGVSTYAFLYIRSGLDPALDMADPETWRSLVSVIRREQFDPRGPLENPINRADLRTPLIFLQQLANYFQYFDWQWAARILRDVPAGLTPRLMFTLLFGALGVWGLELLRQRDRSTFTLLLVLWLITGLGLVVYMNFKPGFSLFWDQYRTMDEHEVRERDYFFTMSFQMWGVFAAFGLVRLARNLAGRLGWGSSAVLGLAALPVALNFSIASRRHGPEATLARDWAYDMLQSVEPYGVLFTFGDNDTYPLWYLQEVEGVRQDVRMMNLSLANTDWHLRFVRDRAPAPFDPTRAPEIHRAPPTPPAGRLFDLDDTTISRLTPMRVAEDVGLSAGATTIPVPAGTVLMPSDQAVLFILAKWLGKRPVVFGLSSAGATALRLDRSLVLKGLVTEVMPRSPDSAGGLAPGIQGFLVDVERTEYLVNNVFRFARLFEVDSLVLDPSSQTVASSISVPFLELGQAYAARRDDAKAVEYFKKAYHLSPNAAVGGVIRQIESVGLESLLRRSTNPPERP